MTAQPKLYVQLSVKLTDGESINQDIAPEFLSVLDGFINLDGVAISLELVKEITIKVQERES